MHSLESRVTLFLAQHKATEFTALDISDAIFPDSGPKRCGDVAFALQNILKKNLLFKKSVVVVSSNLKGALTYSMCPKRTLSDADRDFQDWLCTVGLMTRKNRNFEPLIKLDQSRKDAVLLSQLIAHERFIVPYYMLSRSVYKVTDQMENIGRLFRYLRSHSILGYEDALVVPNFGIGLSVAAIALAAKNLELLDILWKARIVGLEYDSSMLYQKIWGDAHPISTDTMTKLYVLIDTTRNALLGSDCDILTVGRRERKRFLLSRRD